MLECKTVGLLNTNCYLFSCKKNSEALIIDPGFKENEVDIFLNMINENDLQLKYIVNTHGHIDHISGNSILKGATGAEILIHKNDAELLVNPHKNLSTMLGFSLSDIPADRFLKNMDIVEFGSVKLKVLHTPGHTKGSISLYCKSERIVFTGDTLLAGSIGRTDLPSSSFKDIMYSLNILLKRLPNQTVIYPGHGIKTNIGTEKLTNPFFIS